MFTTIVNIVVNIRVKWQSCTGILKSPARALFTVRRSHGPRSGTVLQPGYERRLYRNLALEIVPEKVNLE